MGRIERILNKVDSFNETGRFEEAIKELKKAIDIAPEDPDVLLSFALTYDGMNDLESSMSYFHKAIEVCPNNSLTNSISTSLYNNMGPTSHKIIKSNAKTYVF